MNTSSKFEIPSDDRQIELRSFKPNSLAFKLNVKLNCGRWIEFQEVKYSWQFPIKVYGLKSFCALWLHNMGAWFISWHYDSGAKLTEYALKCYFAVKFIQCFEHEYEIIYAMSNRVD